MIRALIADDEAPARAKLRKLIGGEGDFMFDAGPTPRGFTVSLRIPRRT